MPRLYVNIISKIFYAKKHFEELIALVKIFVHSNCPLVYCPRFHALSKLQNSDKKNTYPVYMHRAPNYSKNMQKKDENHCNIILCNFLP